MSDIYNFYIEKNNETTNELIVRPDYPIICSDKERLSVKLVDFKHLNSIYNISSTLHNNAFALTNYVPEYVVLETTEYTTRLSGTTYLHNIINSTSDEFSTFIRTFDVPSNVEIIESTSGNSLYRLYYYNINNVPTSTYWEKSVIRSDFYNADYSLEFEKDNSWVIIEKMVNTPAVNTFKLEAVKIAMIFPSGTNPYQYPVSITFGMSAYQDLQGQEFQLVPEGTTLTFDPEATASSKEILVMNSVAFKYYKFFIVSTSVPLSLGQVKLQYFFAYKTIYNNVTYPSVTSLKTLSITNGFYNINDLVNAINLKSTAIGAKLTIAKQDYTNKMIFSFTSTPVVGETLQLSFLNKATADIYGLENLSFILNDITTSYTSEKYCNIMNFSKIIISTNLEFSNNTHNIIENNSTIYTKGIGNVLEWLDSDVPPMSCITYKNVENMTHKLSNRYINEFKLLFCTEKSLPIVLDNYLIHLQIIKYKK
jgi:hypothetical protein